MLHTTTGKFPVSSSLFEISSVKHREGAMKAIGSSISATSSSSLLFSVAGGGVRFPNWRLFSSSSSSKTLISTYWNNYNNRIPVNSIMPEFPPSSAASLSTAATTSSPSVEATTPTPKQHPWLIVGLGNPGKKYKGTRHNVGFEMVDAMAEAEGISMTSVSYKAQFGKGFIGNVPVMLAKPQTFMNASGESVAPIVSYYKIPLKQVLVIFDDLDLPFAKLRLLPKGGHGGHNGMRSVIDRFKGSRDFPRLRIGIGRPPGKMDPVGFVMLPFNRHEREELDFTFQKGLEAVRILLLEGFNKSATFVNTDKCLEQLG